MGCGGSTPASLNNGHLTQRTPDEMPDEAWVKRPRINDDSTPDPPGDEELTGLKIRVNVTDLMGRETTVIDTRLNKVNDEGMSRPDTDGNLYTDEEFPLGEALKGQSVKDLLWMRPGEFAASPALVTDGTTRFDIEQGGAGTCWFLSILSVLADKPQVIKHIMPDDAYRIGQEDYNGMFHCRFWKFGQWVDVYCDDLLPVRKWGDGYRAWGARSHDSNEMWVALMEKAFARYNGGYQGVYGGWSGDAFIALTGGVAERILAKNVPKKEFFSRLKNSLNSGAVIACSCPKDKDGQHGLVGHHAYAVTGASTISLNGKCLPMVRVRNPWGTSKGEWTGPWSDGSPEWGKVSKESKDKLMVKAGKDGEFWMTLSDFMKYFPEIAICNFTPDIDKDGKEDGLNQVTCILGEWTRETAMGYETKIKMKNPKYLITVPDTGLGADGTLSVVLQIIKYREKIKSKEKEYSMKLDLYKIEAQNDTDENGSMVLDEMTNYDSYFGGSNYSYRYSLTPGRYMVVPSTYKPGVEEPFCCRIFSSEDIKFSVLKYMPNFYIRKADLQFEQNKRVIQLGSPCIQFGTWIPGESNGASIDQDTFYINPQYKLTLSDDQCFLIDLLQDTASTKLAIGYYIYKLPDDASLPLDQRTIYNIHNTQMVDSVKGGLPYVIGYEAEAYMSLPAGQYVLILFTNDPGVRKDYALVTATEKEGCLQVKLCS